MIMPRAVADYRKAFNGLRNPASPGGVSGSSGKIARNTNEPIRFAASILPGSGGNARG